jgi:hypothetical protein
VLWWEKLWCFRGGEQRERQRERERRERRFRVYKEAPGFRPGPREGGESVRYGGRQHGCGVANAQSARRGHIIETGVESVRGCAPAFARCHMR